MGQQCRAAGRPASAAAVGRPVRVTPARCFRDVGSKFPGTGAVGRTGRGSASRPLPTPAAVDKCFVFKPELSELSPRAGVTSGCLAGFARKRLD